MKFFVLIFALVAAVAAADFEHIDWSNVRPIREMPHFWKNRPAILAVNGKSYIRDRRIVNGEIATLVDFKLFSRINF